MATRIERMGKVYQAFISRRRNEKRVEIMDKASKVFSSRSLDEFRKDAIRIAGDRDDTESMDKDIFHLGIQNGDKIDWDKNFRPVIYEGGFEEGALNAVHSFVNRQFYSVEASEITILWALNYNKVQRNTRYTLSDRNRLGDKADLKRVSEHLQALAKKFLKTAGEKQDIKSEENRWIAQRYDEASYTLLYER